MVICDVKFGRTWTVYLAVYRLNSGLLKASKGFKRLRVHIRSHEMSRKCLGILSFSLCVLHTKRYYYTSVAFIGSIQKCAVRRNFVSGLVSPHLIIRFSLTCKFQYLTNRSYRTKRIVMVIYCEYRNLTILLTPKVNFIKSVTSKYFSDLNRTPINNKHF